MARQPLEAPDYFARLVAAAIRREMGDQRMSGRALARRLGKSEKYARDRVNGTFEFTLNDIENFCLYIGINPEAFIAKIERGELEPVPDTRPAEPAIARTLGEVLDVGARGEDDDEPVNWDDFPVLSESERDQRDLTLAANADPDETAQPAVDEEPDQEEPDDDDARPGA